MATSNSDSIFQARDTQFLMTFAVGMGAFWLSGYLPGLIPASLIPHNYWSVLIISLVLALAIYGAISLLWNFMVLGRQRNRRALLVSTAIVSVLALISSLILTFGKLPTPRGQAGLAIFAFILYLMYGIYYVIGWAVARRLAK